MYKVSIMGARHSARDWRYQHDMSICPHLKMYNDGLWSSCTFLEIVVNLWWLEKKGSEEYFLPNHFCSWQSQLGWFLVLLFVRTLLGKQKVLVERFLPTLLTEPWPDAPSMPTIERNQSSYNQINSLFKKEQWVPLKHPFSSHSKNLLAKSDQVWREYRLTFPTRMLSLQHLWHR